MIAITPRNFAVEYHGEGIQSASPEETTTNRWTSLPWVAFWLQSAEVYHWHDFHTETTPREALGTEAALAYHLHKSDQGIWPYQQEGRRLAPWEDGMPTEIVKRDNYCHFMGTWWTLLFDGPLSSPMPISSRVKQSCVLAPTLFGIFSLVYLARMEYPTRMSLGGQTLQTCLCCFLRAACADGSPINAALHGCVQEAHEDRRSQPRIVGISNCSWSQQLTLCHPDWCQESWGL